ncbi:MAG: WD40/YVTN/BNR-like repeat-containing protein [Acidobacteriota bacterium]
MANVGDDGQLGAGYDLGGAMQLNGIACRYSGEAWVVGAQGTLLYTNDGGASWAAEQVPATGDLRGVATQDFGPVFVVGNGTFLVTQDTGVTWTSLGDGQTQFRAVAAAQEGANVLALSDDGGLWQYDAGALTRRATLAGAHAIALSSDGNLAIVAGQGLARSADGGATWTQLAVDPSLAFDDVRMADDGSAVAVGAAGAIANIDANGAVTLQHVGTADLHALHIADFDSAAGTGFAAGEGGQVLITHDAGATWALGPNLGRTVFGVDEIGLGHR